MYSKIMHVHLLNKNNGGNNSSQYSQSILTHTRHSHPSSYIHAFVEIIFHITCCIYSLYRDIFIWNFLFNAYIYYLNSERVREKKKYPSYTCPETELIKYIDLF